MRVYPFSVEVGLNWCRSRDAFPTLFPSPESILRGEEPLVAGPDLESDSLFSELSETGLYISIISGEKETLRLSGFVRISGILFWPRPGVGLPSEVVSMPPIPNVRGRSGLQ